MFRARGFAALRRGRTDQTMEAMVRQLGRLFVQPTEDQAICAFASNECPVALPELVVEMCLSE